MNFYRSIKRIRESWNDSAAVKITNIRKPEINLNRNKNHSAAALLLPAIAFFFPLFLPSPTDAYIGLCCAKCGGNMPLNLCSAGVPETHEFRITVSPMLMKMSGLQEKEEKINPDSRLSLPSEWYSGLFPGSMSMMMPMSMPMSGMTMAPDNSTVAKDNITGGLTGRKYMAVPVAMRMEMIHVNIGYSFTDHFYGEIMLMAKSSKMKMKYNYMMTQMLGKIYDTMESKGMADTMLMGKYRLYADDSLMPRSQISMIAGVNAPTGSIREKGFSHDMNITQPQALLAHFSDAYREKELLPYSMQLGSGTFDPVAGIEYQGSASPFWWGVNMLYTARVYRNKEGWSPGDELRTDFFLMYQLTYNLVSQIQLNTKAWGKIKGEADEVKTGEIGRNYAHPYSEYMSPEWDPENYGGKSALITVGLQWQPVQFQILEIDVSAPIYQNLNGTQMSEESRIQIAYYFEIPTSASIRSRKNKNINKDGGESKLGF